MGSTLLMRKGSMMVLTGMSTDPIPGSNQTLHHTPWVAGATRAAACWRDFSGGILVRAGGLRCCAILLSAAWTVRLAQVCIGVRGGTLTSTPGSGETARVAGGGAG